MSEKKELVIGGTAVLEDQESSLKEPPMYRVLIHNDDFTPMEFVVHILQQYFNKDKELATEIMLKVHNEGAAVGGVYTYDLAETKQSLTEKAAKEEEYPLKCTVEKIDN